MHVCRCGRTEANSLTVHSFEAIVMVMLFDTMSLTISGLCFTPSEGRWECLAVELWWFLHLKEVFYICSLAYSLGKRVIMMTMMMPACLINVTCFQAEPPESQPSQVGQ